MADEQQEQAPGYGGLRYADKRWHFEKHASFGKDEPMKKVWVRVWGSQPMKVDLKTGKLTGTPHPEQHAIYKDEGVPAAAAQIPTQDVEGKQAYGR